MLSGIARRVIMRYLSEYVKNLDTNLELLSGKLSLNNVMLREEAFGALLGLSDYNMRVITCMGTHMEISVPMTKLKTDPIEVSCESALFSIASQFE